VEALEDGQDIRQRIRLIQLSVDGTLVEKRYTEVKIREGRRREGLDEDVDNHVGVVEIRIELVELQNGKVSKTVVFLAANLVVKIVLEDSDIGRIVAINARDEVFDKL
jgi:hypothetical protein